MSAAASRTSPAAVPTALRELAICGRQARDHASLSQAGHRAIDFCGVAGCFWVPSPLCGSASCGPRYAESLGYSMRQRGILSCRAGVQVSPPTSFPDQSETSSAAKKSSPPPPEWWHRTLRPSCREGRALAEFAGILIILRAWKWRAD